MGDEMLLADSCKESRILNQVRTERVLHLPHPLPRKVMRRFCELEHGCLVLVY